MAKPSTRPSAKSTFCSVAKRPKTGRAAPRQDVHESRYLAARPQAGRRHSRMSWERERLWVPLTSASSSPSDGRRSCLASLPKCSEKICRLDGCHARCWSITSPSSWTRSSPSRRGSASFACVETQSIRERRLAATANNDGISATISKRSSASTAYFVTAFSKPPKLRAHRFRSTTSTFLPSA